MCGAARWAAGDVKCVQQANPKFTMTPNKKYVGEAAGLVFARSGGRRRQMAGGNAVQSLPL